MTNKRSDLAVQDTSEGHDPRSSKGEDPVQAGDEKTITPATEMEQESPVDSPREGPGGYQDSLLTNDGK